MEEYSRPATLPGRIVLERALEVLRASRPRNESR